MSEKVTVKVERNILHLPAIALRGLVVFPNNLLHFEVGRDKSIAAVEWAVRNKSEVFLIAQKDMKAEDPKAEEMYQYGVVAEIKQVMRVSDDLVRILVEGKFRAKRTELDTEGSFLLASVRPAPVRPIKAEEETEAEALLRNVKTSFDAVLSMNPRISKDVVFAVTSNNDPAFLCEYIPANLLFRFEDKQAVMEESTLIGRLRLLVERLHRERRMLEIDKEIAQKVDEAMDKKLLKELKKHLGVDDEVVYKINGPLDLTFLMKVNGIDGFDHLKYPKYKPQPVPGMGDYSHIFDRIKKGDILLFHPYYEFTPVIEFIKQAANDPDVLAIKQTLYRVSGNSPIIAALAQAAENGKQVTVLVELKARFDEENNIAWAKKLEQAGCHVIYGLVGLKTHSKIALVVRREEDGIRRYVHLGTGNYNDQTAKLYTDMGLLTCSDAIGEDATAVFNMLSGYSEPKKWNKLAVAPIWLKDKFLMLIGREAENARQGKKARIVAKMNSLCDPVIMNALYDASKAGVKIELIVRGICCIKAGVPGLSDNISVRSIVGNYLEHSRIFYFYNDGFEDIYMGSADWMPRNLDKRVEITFPVEDPELKKKIKNILKIQLEDTLKNMFLEGSLSFNDEVCITNMRHKAALMDAKESLKQVTESIAQDMPEDFFSIDLMSAYESLGTIIGEAVDDDLVNEIFSKFCMGK